MMFLETKNGLLLRRCNGRWMSDHIVDLAANNISQITSTQVLTGDVVMQAHYSVQEIDASSLSDCALIDSELTLRLAVMLPGEVRHMVSLGATFTIDRSVSQAQHGHAVHRIALADHPSAYITAVEYGDSWQAVQLS